ncbi:ABC-type antimicrobial peptide transport system, permease component [Algoriphagus locisalis]|uniref:ABC-type antimicrobial peptide transport system, permease component n=1 Tax=Algoriphagus locisalis TaxID=305507 RepID=A0A1I6YEI4_9BACT|nr:ABC transporter permease [Algoriphagus locisalis]SFT48810.1 ABC-type antimicrobial peptide transport system, permease component [Algoriphagus locisalis]
MNQRHPTPPKLFLRFFRWFCHPGMLDYIEGDLIEVYERNFKTFGKRKADWRFIKDVLLLFRPGIIRPRKPYQNLTPYGMYKSYFKIGWRTLLRNKEYTLINIAGLALSITCCILIFVLVKHHTGFDDFHQDKDRIYRVVTEQHRESVSYVNSVPSPLGMVLRENHTYGEKVARMFHEANTVISFERNGEKQLIKEPQGFAFTEPEFFDIFNFPLSKGNMKTALKEPNTAIITERLAKKYFGEQNPIGQVITYDNFLPFTITGVLEDLPPNTDISPEIFVSYSSMKDFNPWLASDDAWGGITGGMYCFTKLRSGVSPAEVEEALQPYVKLHRPESKNVHHYKLQALSDVHFDGRYGGAMDKSDIGILIAIGIFLLLTACVNFVNLATAQALKRSKEVGVRKVLGSFRSQLFWQFIFETAIIAIVSILIALVAAFALVPYVNDFFSTQIPVNFLTDGTLVLFIIGLDILITLLAGCYPAFILTGFKPVAALKGKLSMQQLGGFNTRRSLIVMQFAISQVLIIGVIVIMNQMRFAREAELGFDKESIVMVRMGSDSLNTMQTLKNEFLRVPGIEKVSLCFAAPASAGSWNNSIRFGTDTEEVSFRTNMKLADADYLSTFDLELVAGRNLTPSDTVREVVVNEALLQNLGFTSYEDALGEMIYANGGEMTGPIVGVVENFHDRSFHEGISAALITTASNMYFNYAIKINGNSVKATLAEIETLWEEQYPDKMFEYEFVDESIAQFYEAEDTLLKGIQFFSFIAIFIGCLGLYGLISFMISQKTKEVGIRKVMGGGVTHIIWLFGQEFVRLIIIAFLIAAPIGWWFMNQWLQDFEFKITLDAWTFAMAIGSSIIITALTVGYQVFKVAYLNPVISLKTE